MYVHVVLLLARERAGVSGEGGKKERPRATAKSSRRTAAKQRPSPPSSATLPPRAHRVGRLGEQHRLPRRAGRRVHVLVRRVDEAALHLAVKLRARERAARRDGVADDSEPRVAALLALAPVGLLAGERRRVLGPRARRRPAAKGAVVRDRRRLDVGERERLGADEQAPRLVLDHLVEVLGALAVRLQVDARRQLPDLRRRQPERGARARGGDALAAQRGGARARAARGGAARRRSLDLLLEARPQRRLVAGDGQAGLLCGVIGVSGFKDRRGTDRVR